MRFKSLEEIKKLTDSEKNLYALELFDHYRKVGFPHTKFTDGYRYRMFNELKKVNLRDAWEIDPSGDVYTSSYQLGYNIACSFMPHRQAVRTHTVTSLKSYNPSPVDVFNDDKLFLIQLRKLIKFFKADDNNVRNFLKYGVNAKLVSNYKPVSAMSIWNKYMLPGNGVVWDPSMGFGGRLLGALAFSKITKYIGTDPAEETFKCLVEMSKFFEGDKGTYTCAHPKIFRNTKTQLICSGSEDVLDHMDKADIGKVGCVFTSPPYYAQEAYSNEETQSWKKFPTQQEWMNGFLRTTLLNAKKVIAKDAYIIINIDNVATYRNLVDDMLKMVVEDEDKGGCGLALRDTIYVRLGNIAHLNMSKIKKKLSDQGVDATDFGMKPEGQFKRERIFIFQRKEDKHWVKHEAKKTLF